MPDRDDLAHGRRLCREQENECQKYRQPFDF